MLRIIFRLTAMCFILLAPYATAQIVLQADNAVLQPQIARDGEGFNRCGVRALVIVSRGDKQSKDVYDFSVMLDSQLSFATMKAGKSVARLDAKAQKMTDPVIILPIPSSFWIADELEGKSAAIDKTYPSEDKGYILGLAEIVPAFKAMRAMMDGRRVQFVMRYKSEKLDRVISFSAKLSPEELAPLEKCFADLIERMSAESPAAKKQ